MVFITMATTLRSIALTKIPVHKKCPFMLGSAWCSTAAQNKNNWSVRYKNNGREDKSHDMDAYKDPARKDHFLLVTLFLQRDVDLSISGIKLMWKHLKADAHAYSQRLASDTQNDRTTPTVTTESQSDWCDSSTVHQCQNNNNINNGTSVFAPPSAYKATSVMPINKRRQRADLRLDLPEIAYCRPDFTLSAPVEPTVSYMSFVQDFFSAVKEASRDTSGQHSPIQSHLSSVSSTSSTSSDSGTQRYELLYVGKIKVSHRKPPSTFIDEAVDRFRVLECEKLKHFQDLGSTGNYERQRHGSGTSITSLPPNLEHFVSIRENELDGQVGRLAGGSTSSNEGGSSTEKIAVRGHRRACSVEGDLVVRKASDSDLNSATNNNNVSEAKTLFRNAENSHPLQWTTDTSPVSSSSDVRSRSCSVGNDVQGRTRSNSIASGQNRTMVFQIGKTEISLISLDKKSIILSKPFRDISHCSQGMRHPDHFGFICRDVGSETYLGYILKCQAENVTEEILTTLKQVFASAAALQRTLRNQFLMCETCPMLWLHKLCMDLEGLPASKANTIITRRLDTLSGEEKHEILMKLKGAEVTSSQEQNEILMMLLRAHCETKQSKHTHVDTQGGKLEQLNVGFFDKKHQPSVLDDLKNKAKRSLTSSFENILKRKPQDDARKAFRERSNTIDVDSSSYRDSSNGATPDHSPTSTPDRKESSFDFLEGINENNPFRRRSSTVGIMRDRNAEVQPPRREFPQHPRSRLIKQKTSPMMNIFMKVGNPSKPTTPDDEMVTPNKTGSWRQAIFNRVVTPHRKPPDCSNKSLDGLSLSACSPAGPPIKRSPATLRSLWKKAIKQQILLIRMEKENKKLKANQDAVQVKRVKLDYEEITPCLKEITKVWDEMLKKEKSEKIRFQILVDAVKAGVPRPRRGEIWQLLAEQHNANAEDGVSEVPNEDLSSCYEDLLKQLTAQQHAILIDLGRTFPSHPYFSVSLGAGQLSLFNLLKAYSLLDKEVGYCQGLSFIAGVLLLHMEEDNSFEMLKHILYTLGFRKQFKPDMIALQIQMYQLSRLIHDQHPDLYNHFERHEIAPTLYAAPWFLTLFASQFPLGFVSRVFDLIFLYGLEVVFKVALVLLGNHKELIIQCNTFESVMDFLKCTMPGMGIIQMERVFNQVFNLNISKQLQAYEVEYHVLQEESLSGPPPGVDLETMAQLELANRNLKRHNADLMEENQTTHNNLRTLERTISSYQACTSKQESRLKTLELEKTQLKQLVETLKKNWPKDHFETCSDILSNYELDQLRSESRSPRPYRMPASEFPFNRTINRHSSHSPAHLEEDDGDDEDMYLTNGYERSSHPSKIRISVNGRKAN